MLVEYFLRNKFGHGFNSHHLHKEREFPPNGGSPARVTILPISTIITKKNISAEDFFAAVRRNSADRASVSMKISEYPPSD